MKKITLFTKKLLRSFYHAFAGLWEMCRHERNFKIHLLGAVMVIIAGILSKINRYDWMAISFAIAIVLITETINSAVEKLADVVQPEYSESIKKVKDIAAGAVVIAAIVAVVIAGLVFV